MSRETDITPKYIRIRENRLKILLETQFVNHYADVFYLVNFQHKYLHSDTISKITSDKFVIEGLYIKDGNLMIDVKDISQEKNQN